MVTGLAAPGTDQCGEKRDGAGVFGFRVTRVAQP